MKSLPTNTATVGSVAKMRRTKTEADVQRECTELLTSLGILWWRTNTGSQMSEYKGKKRFIRYGKVGGSDVEFLLRVCTFPAVGSCSNITPALFVARACYLECKRPLGPKGGTHGSEQSDDQRAFQAKVERVGALYVLARSVDDLKAALRQNGVKV